MRASRIMLWVLGCTVPLGLLSGMIMWTFGPFGHFLTGLLWIFNINLILAAMAMQGYERGRAKPLMLGGLAAAGGSFLVWATFAWLIHDAEVRGEASEIPQWLRGAATLFLAMSVYSALAGMVFNIRVVNRPALWLRWFVLGLGAVAVIHASAAVIAFPLLDLRPRAAEDYVFLHVRWGAAYLILIVCASLACAGLYYLRQFIGGEEAVIQRLPVKLRCPRCGAAQQLHTEGDACASCGLRIKVSLP